MTKSFLSSFQQFAESSHRLEELVQQLPENLREQLSQFIEDVERKQEGFQKTLKQAEKTTLAVNTALEKVDKVAGSLDTAAVNITETAEAWEIAATATGQVVQEFNKNKTTPQEGASFDISEYRATVEEVSHAANDIKELLAAIEDFPSSQGYSSIVNHLSLRAAGLVILIFVLAVLYRMIAIRPMRS